LLHLRDDDLRMKVAIARRHRGAHGPFRVGCVDTGSRNLCHRPFPRGNCSPDADAVQLEELAFRLAAKQLTPAIEAELRSHLKALNASAKARDHFAAAEADLKFHEAVWRASGNPVLERTHASALLSRRLSVSNSMRLATARPTNVSLDALLSGKARSRLIREHLKSETVLPASMR
jgi:FCD domain